MNLEQELEKLGNESKYEEQGTFFLEYCRVVMHAVKCVPQLPPQWASEGNHGTQWHITLAKLAKDQTFGKFDSFERTLKYCTHSITFPFWSSIHNKEEAIKKGRPEKPPKAYDVLAGLYHPDTDSFQEFCDSLGYDRDSIKALETFHAVQEMNVKLRTIFTQEELQALQTIA